MSTNAAEVAQQRDRQTDEVIRTEQLTKVYPGDIHAVVDLDL